MGIDYRKFGLDPDVATDESILRGQAAQAAVAALNAQVEQALAQDDEDRVILTERCEEACRVAEDLRIKAKLTKAEIRDYRAQAIQGKRIELAKRHLDLETTAKALEAAGRSATAQRDEQAVIETGMETLDLL